MCVFVLSTHFNDVVAAEDSACVASIAVFSDGALQLRRKHTEDDQYCCSNVNKNAVFLHHTCVIQLSGRRYDESIFILRKRNEQVTSASTSINKRQSLFMFSSKNHR